MISLADIYLLVSPPKRSDVILELLLENEKVFHFTFPCSFVEFCKAYGSGFFRSSYEGIEIYNPLAKDFRSKCAQTITFYSEWLEEHPEIPYGMHPMNPGLFPLGRDENGTANFWLINGTELSIVIIGPDYRHQEVKGDFLDFFYRTLQGDDDLISCQNYGEDITFPQPFIFAQH